MIKILVQVVGQAFKSCGVIAMLIIHCLARTEWSMGVTLAQRARNKEGIFRSRTCAASALFPSTTMKTN